jgi:hypothetical protein
MLNLHPFLKPSHISQQRSAKAHATVMRHEMVLANNLEHLADLAVWIEQKQEIADIRRSLYLDEVRARATEVVERVERVGQIKREEKLYKSYR